MMILWMAILKLVIRNKYKAKLLGKSEVDGANGIIKIGAILVPLKYLSKFWRSLKTPFMNCKVELKLKLWCHCALSAAGADNDDTNSIIFLLLKTKLYALVVSSAKSN